MAENMNDRSTSNKHCGWRQTQKKYSVHHKCHGIDIDIVTEPKDVDHTCTNIDKHYLKDVEHAQEVIRANNTKYIANLKTLQESHQCQLSALVANLQEENLRTLDGLTCALRLGMSGSVGDRAKLPGIPTLDEIANPQKGQPSIKELSNFEEVCKEKHERAPANKSCILRNSLISDCSEGTSSTVAPEQEGSVRKSSRLFKSMVPSRGRVGTHLGSGRSMFVDVDILKEQVRKAITVKSYNVKDFYKREGPAQSIAKSEWFEYLTLFMIACNTLWIAFDTDLNGGKTLVDTDAVWQIGEHLFCIFFLVEWSIRFMAFRNKKDTFQDGWFVFDTILLVMMIIETWVLSMLWLLLEGTTVEGSGLDTSILRLFRLIKLIRMTRLIRLLREMQELVILAKGLIAAWKPVFFTLLLTFVTVYIFAIAFRQLTDGTELGEQYFDGIPSSIVTLLLEGTLPDLAILVRQCGQQHVLLAGLMMIFILLTTLTLMNMLVGVLVEVVNNVSVVEKEQMLVSQVRSQMTRFFENYTIDKDGNSCLSKEEFGNFLVIPEVATFLQSVGVDVVGLVEFIELIFADEDELLFCQVLELILELRGSNKATVKDVVNLRKYMSQEIQKLKLDITGTPGSTQQQSMGDGAPVRVSKSWRYTSPRELPTPPTINSKAWLDDIAWSMNSNAWLDDLEQFEC